MTNRNTLDRDRRSSVRVSGRNLFYCEPVSKEQYEIISSDYAKGIPPYNQEGLAEVQVFVGAQSALSRIKEKDNDLGEFLGHLDTKMNLLLRKIDRGKGFFDRMRTQELTMSGSGISFVDDNDYASGDILALHIVLLPDYSYVYCLAEVKTCSAVKEVDDKSYFRVAAEYLLIMEDDREKIIQQNFKQQSLALRARRKNK